MIKWLKKKILIRKAKRHYLAYLNLQDRYSCGNKMIDEITGGKLGHHRNMFNIIMDQLSILDKNTPKSRL